MDTSQEPNEDRLDRIERILAETVAGLAEVRTVQAEAAAAQAEAAAAQAEAAAASEERLLRIEAMVEANTAAIAALGERVDRLTEQQHRTNQDMSVIKGWQTELNVERNAGDVFARLSSNGDLFRLYPREDLSHYIGYGTRAGFVSRAEADKIRAVDFLMEGTDSDGSPVMFAVEVSYTAGYDDIERAVERAPLAARLLGRQVVPAVAAEVISMEFEEKAQRYGVKWTYVPNGNRIMQ